MFETSWTHGMMRLPPAPKQLADILLVEDNMGDVKLIKIVLRKEHVNVNLHHVATGEQAICFLNKMDAYENAPTPDLIFLDINLPMINGHQVAEFIKSHPQLKNIPFYMLTSSQHPYDVSSAHKNGASCYFTKPLDFAKLQEIIGLSSHIRFEEENGQIYVCKM